MVVLKQGERATAKWLIDLLHEMFHAARFPELLEATVIEEPETSDHRREDLEERQATWFASLVATERKAEELFERVYSQTGGNMGFFKTAVARVPSARSAGCLAWRIH